MKNLLPTIIYEDDSALVINKPAGLVVHPDGRNKEYCLTDWLLEKYPELKDVGEPMELKDQRTGDITLIPRPGIVHRLDRETSGVMIIAKNQKTFLFLKKQFQEHTIRKVYRAFVYGWVKNDMGTIDAPIGRSGSDIRRWNSGRGARGVMRPARTMYRTISRFSDIDTDGERVPMENRFSYVELYPQTGRTHQLRVHLRFINHSIVSDMLYSGKKENALGFDRVALHACSLECRLPNKSSDIVENKQKKVQKFEAPLPDDFLSAEVLAKISF